ncbi:MAG: 4-hydroxy-tetrahydrodipicolinate synthase [archaeon]|nr:4-hydroxy-tetrahydrodipicolinate synthase [archaeon]
MSRINELKNTFTALITPWTEDLEIDEPKLREFIRFQIKKGAGLVPCGTTGESATMSHDEHHQVISITIDEAKKSAEKPFVLAGTGSNYTKEAISLTQFAEKAGADGALIITPYYNKPTQKGLIAHYTAIAESTSIPIVVYNVPSRTGRNILPDTVAELAKLDNIIGYKAASGDIEQIKEVINKTPDDFIVMSGDDGLTYDIMVAGGKGVISVASNIVPDKVRIMTELITDGKLDEGKAKFDELKDLFKGLFVETNPGPVKYAAELMNIMPKRMRLPMVPPEPESEEKIKEVLRKLSII